jgi:hypothetical protein
VARNYRIGRADEIALRDQCTGVGMLVVRAAGSKGRADLVAFDRHGVAYALNVKRNTWARPAERTAMGTWLAFGVMPVLCRCDAGAGRQRRWSYRRCSASGEMGAVLACAPWSPDALRTGGAAGRRRRAQGEAHA